MSADAMVPLRMLESGEMVELNLVQMTLGLAIEGDTLLVHAERPPDTVVVTVPIRVPQPLPEKNKEVHWGALLFLTFLLVLFLINIKITKK